MMGHRLPRRSDVRSRSGKDGSRTRCATVLEKPIPTVGRVRSSRSSVSAASVAFEHTSVAPASIVDRNENAYPPIQKNGEFENNTSSLGVVVELVESLEVANQRTVFVDDALGFARGTRRVDDDQSIRRANGALDCCKQVVADTPTRLGDRTCVEHDASERRDVRREQRHVRRRVEPVHRIL